MGRSMHSRLPGMRPVQRRRVLTLAEKIAVIGKLDSGISCRQLAMELGIGKTQVSRMKNDRELLLNQWESGARANMKTKRKKSVYENLNIEMYEWYSAMKAKSIPVTGRLIQVRIRMHACLFSQSPSWVHLLT